MSSTEFWIASSLCYSVRLCGSIKKLYSRIKKPQRSMSCTEFLLVFPLCHSVVLKKIFLSALPVQWQNAKQPPQTLPHFPQRSPDMLSNPLAFVDMGHVGDSP